MRLLTIMLTLLSISFISCRIEKSNFQKEKIDLEMVDLIEITNRAQRFDSTQIHIDTIRASHNYLTEKQVEEFVNKWNETNSTALVKSIPKYWIILYFKDGTKRIISVSGKYLKEGSDWAVDFNDENFIENIWNEQSKK